MLILSNYVLLACINTIQIGPMVTFWVFSALEHCRKVKFRTYLHLTIFKQFFMLSRLSDFVL